MFRRTVYATSAVAAVGLIGTLVWNVLDRHPLHLADRSIRATEWARGKLRF